MLALPFAGPTVIPPAIAFYIEFDTVHSFERPRLARDDRGYDCNDYAFDAVQALLVEGRAPYYVVCVDERGEGHLIAAYAAHDGVLYARDNRAGDDDILLEELVRRGYQLKSAADHRGLLWHAPAS